ncbi:hypothetical protein fHeYen902_078c [Yersinia phage fHe-Yen9-02]|nr:hypothetical protein fHeYen902_078c [Yersinia phage fHe-Yen9-02]
MAKTAKKTEVAISTSINYSSKNMNSLRGARTATEFTNLLNGIVESVSGYKIPTKLASVSAKAIELSDLESIKSKQSKTIDLTSVIDISKLDITDVQSKAKYNRQVGQLNQALAELNVAYQILSSKTFASFKNQTQAASNLLTVIKQAQELQTKMVKLMSIDVKKDAPPEHTKLAATIANYLTKILNKEQFSKIRMRTFIASGVDPITFQTYIFVDNFVNSDGDHYQNYAVVLSTSIALATGLSTNYVTTLVDEKVPGSFPMGRIVETAPSLKKAINSLLAVDGFLNYSERKPINKDTSTIRNTTMLGQRDHTVAGRQVEILDNVRVQNDKLYVRLIRGLTPAEKKQAVQEVLAMASVVLRSGKNGKNSMIHRLVKGRGGREFVEVSLTSSGGTAKGVLTLAKIDQVAEVFGLNPDQKRLLKQSVK